VSPGSGLLSQGGNMQVTVEYQTLVVGNHSADMILHYDTGQWLKTLLFSTFMTNC